MIGCTPTIKVLILKVPLPPLRVVLPMETPLSSKVTVPVGVPAPGARALTVAVNVTVWPNTDGLTEDTTLVLLLAWLTVSVSVGLVLVV